MLYLRTAIWVLITLTLNSIAPPCFAGNAKLWNCANTCCHLILLVISLVVRCPNDYKPSSCFFILFVLTSFPTKWELPPPKMYIYFLLMIFSYLWSFALIFLILLLFKKSKIILVQVTEIPIHPKWKRREGIYQFG